MVSLDTIEQSIIELEGKDTSFATCEKLAWLYIVRDHLRGYSSESQAPIDVTGNSELLQAVNGRNAKAVWAIIDEHMDAVKAIYPSEYRAVIDQILSVNDTH